MSTQRERARIAREKLGLSQQELAEKVKVSQSTIGNLETKDDTYNPRKLNQIAYALEMTPEELRFGIKPESTKQENTTSSNPQSFAHEVWQNLSSLEVKGLGENEPENMTWTSAWALLMRYYPESEIGNVEESKREDGTMIIKASIIVKSGDKSLTRSMWLPVKDKNQNIVQNPDAGQIYDSTMLCLVKCLNLFGLGMSFCTK